MDSVLKYLLRQATWSDIKFRLCREHSASFPGLDPSFLCTTRIGEEPMFHLFCVQPELVKNQCFRVVLVPVMPRNNVRRVGTVLNMHLKRTPLSCRNNR